MPASHGRFRVLAQDGLDLHPELSEIAAPHDRPELVELMVREFLDQAG